MPLIALDPRRHLAAAIGWSVLAVVSLASLVAGDRAAAEAEQAAREGTQRLMAQFATQIQHGLGMNLQTRLSIVQATAAQIAVSHDRGADALRRHLDALRAQFPEFAWLGVADAEGKLITATGNVLQGESVAQRPWFRSGRAAPYLGDVHQAVLLERHLPRTPDGQPLRFVDAAAPIRQESGAMIGVIGGHLSWGWIERLHEDLLGALDSRRQLELVLTDDDGTVLVGPAAWRGRRIQTVEDTTEGGSYIVGRHAAIDVKNGSLGWSVMVRQRVEPALAHVRSLRQTVFATVLAMGLLAALAAMTVTRWLTRRLMALASDAQAVRMGVKAGITVPRGEDEVSRIGATMSDLIGHLQDEKAALARLNAELDARVVERTLRIERLAEEAKHAAVTRERLRLARDLHDTLAHSLMALLTQIRLVRKLKDKMSASELAMELGRAEEVAASGLSEARAAITEMRHGTVRESGLAAALRELLSRFGERTGVATRLHAEGAAADLADERAETLYRIVEEALRNVERHAHARSVQVSIADAAGGTDANLAAVLAVRDDGVGFDPTAACPGHYGLIGIREQAALIGARLDVDSRPGTGTEIRLAFAA